MKQIVQNQPGFPMVTEVLFVAFWRKSANVLGDGWLS